MKRYQFLESIKNYDSNVAKEYYQDAIKLEEKGSFRVLEFCCYLTQRFGLIFIVC